MLFLTRLNATPGQRFLFRHFSVKPLKFEFSSFCFDILITVLSRVLKIKKKNLVKLTFQTAISCDQVMGKSPKTCGLCKMFHALYGLFLASDWLKTKGSGRVMG